MGKLIIMFPQASRDARTMREMVRMLDEKLEDKSIDRATIREVHEIAAELEALIQAGETGA